MDIRILYKVNFNVIQHPIIEASLIKANSLSYIYKDNTLSALNMQDSLTVYSQSAHIVTRLSGGRITLPTSTILNSIIVLDNTRKMVPYDVTSSSIPDDNGCLPIGHKAKVYGQDRSFSGKILACNANRVSLSNNDTTTTIRNFEAIQGTSYEVEVTTQRQATTISYRIDNIYWMPIGTAIVDESLGIVNFYLTGDIINNTGVTFDSNLTLVGGDVNQENKVSASRVIALAASSVQVSTDAISFPLGRKVVDRQTNLEIASFQSKIEKIYSATTDSNRVMYGYQFVSHTRLPSLVVNSYTQDGLRFVGTSSIPEVQVGDNVVLELGTGGQVSIATNVERVENDKIIDLKILSHIRNYNSKSIVFELKHYVGDLAVAPPSRQACTWNRKEAGFVIWRIQVTPNDSYIFECQLQLHNNDLNST